MAATIDRSMNADLRRGAVDGRLRFQRPDAANAKTLAVESRVQALHPQHYGTLGLTEDAQGIIKAALPAAVPGNKPTRVDNDHIVY